MDSTLDYGMGKGVPNSLNRDPCQEDSNMGRNFCSS